MLNSHRAVSDLLDKRAVYADRPQIQMMHLYAPCSLLIPNPNLDPLEWALERSSRFCRTARGGGYYARQSTRTCKSPPSPSIGPLTNLKRVASLRDYSTTEMSVSSRTCSSKLMTRLTQPQADPHWISAGQPRPSSPAHTATNSLQPPPPQTLSSPTWRNSSPESPKAPNRPAS